MPTTVTVTGAAGQIGYALLFRIANGQIFKPQGDALNAGAADDVRILVVGNPANTNALIAMNNAPDIPDERFSAMTRLDENRAVAQLAEKVGAGVEDVQDLAVWGNHSPTMFPDLFNAKVKGERAVDKVDMDWYENEYIPRVGKRGAEIIEARGASSAASAANAAIDHVGDWVGGTADGDWISMAVPSDGSYGVEEGIISSFPCRCASGEYEIVQGLDVPEFSQRRIDRTLAELRDRDARARAHQLERLERARARAARAAAAAVGGGAATARRGGGAGRL